MRKQRAIFSWKKVVGNEQLFFSNQRGERQRLHKVIYKRDKETQGNITGI